MSGNKKNGKKKKEPEENEVLTEVDREFYEIQVSDLNRKLNRLRNKTSELESLNSLLEDKLKQLDEDRSDVIAYLKKTLETKTNEWSELQERFEGLKQSMEMGVLTYREKITQMQQEFKNKQDELTSDIKLLMGKLNSLEEFRIQKEELIEKFSDQERRMAEQESYHKKNLYESEKNFVLQKNKLKKEMERRLLQLSLKFQEAFDIRIAATTQKMIQENIGINNELTVMQESQQDMIKAYEEINKKLQKAKVFAKLQEEEKNRVLKKNLMQIELINELIAKHKESTEKIKRLTKAEMECKILEKKLEETEQKLNEVKDENKKLSDKLSSGQSNAAKLYADIAALEINSRRLYGILYKAVYAVKDVLLMQEEPIKSEEIILSKRLNLLNNLLQILNRSEMTERGRHLLTQKMSHSYEKGDLGFIPKEKDIEREVSED